MEKEFASERIREFTRYYMSVFSLLEKSYLGTEYSVSEARILYEIWENSDCTAGDLGKKIHIDKGYLSRIIQRFEKRGLLTRRTDEGDSRRLLLLLTEKGKRETEELIRMSNRQIGELIQGVSEKECHSLCEAMDRISDILGRSVEHGDY